MSQKFSEIMTQLRREKGLSQKAVAAELNTSQALLSHYENGIRECGLDFAVRAANFYGVTCDYILGNSTSRNGLPEYEKPDLEPSSELCGISTNIILNAVKDFLDQISTCSEPWRDELKGYIILNVYSCILTAAGENYRRSSERLDAKTARDIADAMLTIKKALLENQPAENKPQISADSPLQTLMDSAEMYMSEKMAWILESKK